MSQKRESSTFEQVCVVGLGYIGLPTASILANSGFRVIAVEIDEEVLRLAKAGETRIVEEGLDDLLKSGVESGRLMVSPTPQPADAFIICVPTPCTAEHKCDLSFVRAATESLVPYLRAGNLVVVESTIPPAATEEVVKPILEKSGLRVPEELHLAYCPERVLPGQILRELVENTRIIGGINRQSAERAKELYRSFVKGEILLTDAATAELVKLVENAFRDVNIAFANEISKICDKLAINAWEVISLANMHPRVKILKPGPGVGGHCIPIDPWFIVEKTPEQAKLMETARQVNDSMPAYVVAKVQDAVRMIPHPLISCLGIAYKPGVGDVRESPALEVIRRLKSNGYVVRACDPYADNIPGLELLPLPEAIDGADCIVILTDHKEFKEPGFLEKLNDSINAVIIDTRGLLKRT